MRLCIVTAIALILALSPLFLPGNEERKISCFVRSNRVELEKIALRCLDGDEPAARYKRVRVEGVFHEDLPIVQFYDSGFGLVPSTTYYGFYYSKDNLPADFQNVGCELAQTSQDEWAWKAAGTDNGGLTKRITDCWFFIKHGFKTTQSGHFYTLCFMLGAGGFIMVYQRTIPRLSDRLWAVVTRLGRRIPFSEGQVLYEQNAPSGGFFFLESGRVKVSHILDDGSESIVALYGPRDQVGETSALESDSSPAAIAMTPVTAYLLTTSQAEQLIQEDGEFAHYLVDMLAYKLRMANAHLCTVSGKRGDAKLAATLLLLPELGVPWDADGWFSTTHAQLACFTGATRANTTLTLRRFAAAGIVAIQRGKLRILNSSRLRELSEGATL